MPDGLAADDDTGYFLEGGDVCQGLTKTCTSATCVQVQADPKYIAIGRLLPYASNMQVKSSITAVKHCPPTPMDLVRLYSMIRGSPFRAHTPLESLAPGYSGAPPYVGATATAAFLAQVRSAIAATA